MNDHINPSSRSDSRLPPLLNRENQLRRNQTPPEGIMWSYLRDRRLGGLKFRRQHPIGPYIADFYCSEARLIVEIDGAHHAERVEHDARRDAWMAREDLLVKRYPATLFRSSKEEVLKDILRAAAERIGRPFEHLWDLTVKRRLEMERGGEKKG